MVFNVAFFDQVFLIPSDIPLATGNFNCDLYYFLLVFYKIALFTDKIIIFINHTHTKAYCRKWKFVFLNQL